MNEKQRAPLGATDGIARRLVNEPGITNAHALRWSKERLKLLEECIDQMPRRH